MGLTAVPLKGRTYDSIKKQYEIERELASRLRCATREHRKRLYPLVYDEFFKLVPDHPLLIQKLDHEASSRAVIQWLRLLGRFLDARSAFLEVGPGDCKLALEVAKQVRKVYAIDVSNEITSGVTQPPNFELVISDGISIPVPEGIITVAYSNQLMEHLHPDDAMEQLCNIFKVLAHGGIYVCVTPHRFSGPHDISQYFDDVPTGFHLKEYTFSELEALFRRAGFSRISAYAGGKGIYVRSPLLLVKLFESVLGALPFSLRRRIARSLPVRVLLGVIIVGRK